MILADFSWKIAELALNNNHSLTPHHELLDPCRMSLSKLNMDIDGLRYEFLDTFIISLSILNTDMF